MTSTTPRARMPSSRSQASTTSSPSTPSTRAHHQSPTHTTFNPTISPSLQHTHTPSSSSHVPVPSSPAPSQLALDMRRLLAKPAPPYARTTPGSGSESEGPHHSFSDGGERERKQRRQREHERDVVGEIVGEAMREVAFDRRGPLNLDLELGVPPSKAPRSRSRSRARSETRAPTPGPAPEKEKDKRQRNVLRRRPSSTHPRPQALGTQAPNTTPSSPRAVPYLSLHSPLPPLSPTSPLTPSMLPSGSPRLDETSGDGGLGTAGTTPSVRVTKVNGDATRAYPFPSSPSPPSSSPAPSRSHSPHRASHSSPHHHQPHLSTALNNSTSSLPSALKGASGSRSRSTSRQRPLDQQDHRRHQSSTIPAPTSAKAHLTPAAAVVAAYKRQTAIQDAVEAAAAGDYDDDDVPPVSQSHFVAAPSRTEAHPYSRPLQTQTQAQTHNTPTSTSTVHHHSHTHRAHNPNHTHTPSHTHTRTPFSSLGRAAGGSVSSGFSRLSGLHDDDGEGEGFGLIERVMVRGHGHAPADAGQGKRPHRSSVSVSGSTVGVGPAEQNLKTKGMATGEGGGPYFTVFGSPSGRVVAVGRPEDHHYSYSHTHAHSQSYLRHHTSWDVSQQTGLGRRSTVAAGVGGAGGESGSGSGIGGLKTLTRKVSGRWRRSVEREREKELDKGEKRRGVSMSIDRDVGRQRELTAKEETRRGVSMSVEGHVARGRPSLQEKRAVSGREGSRSGGKRTAVSSDLGHGHAAHRRSLRLSITAFPEEIRALRLDRNRELEKASEDKALKSPVKSATPSPNHNHNTSGNKIWKLVKRISTGALRDKYTAEEAPPVPALPKEYSASPIRSAEGETRRVVSGASTSSLSSPGFGKSVRRKASVVLGVSTSSLSSPSTPSKPTPSPSRTLPRSPLHSQTSVPAARPSPPTSNARRSTTTRSSSPNSSDVASTRFFTRQSASAHSSSSSLPLEDVPPMPKLNKGVGHHIIPPSELGRIHSDEGHGGSQESHLTRRSRSSLVSPSKPPTTPSRSPSAGTSSSNPLKKLKLALPSNPYFTSPTKAQSQQARMSDDWMIVHTPAVELASLPLPPRRGTRRAVRHQVEVEPEDEWERAWGGGKEDTSNQTSPRAPSPTIPSFSTAAPINAFPAKRASTDVKRSRPSPISTTTPPATGSIPEGDGPHALSPPPRPSRSRQRPHGRTLSTPTSPIKPKVLPRVPVPPCDLTATPRTSSFTATAVAPNPNRDSTGVHSTTSTATITHDAHTRRRSSSYISYISSIASPPSTPPRRFREIGRHPEPLSEQEKAARWDDLLERSAQAGGTLHLDMGGRSGEHGLRSDRLRFSEISSVTSL